MTTQFHKFTQERDAAVARARAGGLSPDQIELLEEVKKWDAKISEIGGREEYQKASQLNTELFSTSKWVLGILGRWGWLDGLKTTPAPDTSCDGTRSNALKHDSQKKRKEDKTPRRDVQLLEVGAINTQLLDAAARTRMISNTNGTGRSSRGGNDGFAAPKSERVYRLDVKAIDIRSTDPRILQMDFFELPVPESDPNNQTISTIHSDHHPFYDVIVNSMVINCVTTAAKRGKMLTLLYQHLRPGGVCFLTLPKLCLIQSKCMSRSYFEEILTKGVGFEILQEVGRESPKVAFYVLRRPNKVEDNNTSSSVDMIEQWDDKFAVTKVLHHGKKFRNTFAVTLNKE